MQVEIVSDELVSRLRQRQSSVMDNARELLSRAVARNDPSMITAAASHVQELQAHLGLVDALLDALVVDGEES